MFMVFCCWCSVTFLVSHFCCFSFLGFSFTLSLSFVVVSYVFLSPTHCSVFSGFFSGFSSSLISHVVFIAGDQ